MSPSEINRQLQKTLGFSDEDLVHNDNGKLSEHQQCTLAAKEQATQRQLMRIAVVVAAIGIAALFYAPMLGVILSAVAAGAYFIRTISTRKQAGFDDTCEAVSGPIELRKGSTGGHDISEGGRASYRIWGGMTYQTDEDGRTISAAEKIFRVPKEVWESFVSGGDYVLYHHRGKLVAARCREMEAKPAAG